MIARHALDAVRRRRRTLGDAFRAGYEAVRPWPEADPDTVAALTAARHLNMLNFGLSMRGPGLDDVRRAARRAGRRLDDGRRASWLLPARPAGGATRRRISRAWATPCRPTLRVRSSSTQSGSVGAAGQQPQLHRSHLPAWRRSVPILVAVSLLMVRVSPRGETLKRDRTRCPPPCMFSIADGSVIPRSIA